MGSDWGMQKRGVHMRRVQRCDQCSGKGGVGLRLQERIAECVVV